MLIINNDSLILNLQLSLLYIKLCMLIYEVICFLYIHLKRGYSRNVNKCFVYILKFYICKIDLLNEYLTLFWFAMLIN